MVSFNSVPTALRTPFVTAEFDSSRSSQGPALLAFRALIVGQKHSGGTAAANTTHKVTNADQVATLAGRGSMLHRQALAWFAANKSTEVLIGVLADDGAGVAATGTLTVTGPATADGALSIYVGGTLVRVPVTAAQTASQIATAIVTAIGATISLTDLPVTAGAVAGVVTLTAKNKGATGNEIDLRLNYTAGEALPAGVAVTVAGMSAGATNPQLATLIAALGDSWFNVIANPYTDATSLAALEAELSSRFGPMRMIDGFAIAAKNDTVSNLGTLGDSRNSQHSAIVSIEGSPTWSVEASAHVAGVVAYYSAIDPARPLTSLEMPWIKAPAEVDRETLQERNLLLFDGISTVRVAAGDMVQIERLVTTYQRNAAGSTDTAYLSVETMFTLAYLRYSFRARMATRYPRHKLANDGARVGAGQAVITPKIGKAEAVAWFQEMAELGLVEGLDQFKADLVVERNVADPNRLDFLLPPDLVNQLVVTAASIQFRV